MVFCHNSAKHFFVLTWMHGTQSNEKIIMDLLSIFCNGVLIGRQLNKMISRYTESSLICYLLYLIIITDHLNSREIDKDDENDDDAHLRKKRDSVYRLRSDKLKCV